MLNVSKILSNISFYLQSQPMLLFWRRGSKEGAAQTRLYRKRKDLSLSGCYLRTEAGLSFILRRNFCFHSLEELNSLKQLIRLLFLFNQGFFCWFFFFLKRVCFRLVGRSCSPMQAGDGCQRGSRWGEAPLWSLRCFFWSFLVKKMY